MPIRKKKINLKFQNFFKQKKTVFVLPKINSRKVKMFFLKLSFRKTNKNEGFLEPRSRRARQIWADWKLARLRAQALKAENTENGSLYESLKSKISDGIRGLKGMKGKVILKKAFAMMTIFAVLVTAYFQGAPRGEAATLTP